MTSVSTLLCVAILAVSCHGHPSSKTSFRQEKSLDITPPRRTRLNTNTDRVRRQVPPSSYKPIEPPRVAPPQPPLFIVPPILFSYAQKYEPYKPGEWSGYGCFRADFLPGRICGPVEIPIRAEAPIIEQDNDYNGTFFYNFKDESGTYVEVYGYPKTLDNGAVVQAMRGEYSHTAPDGTLITTKWFADETGYHSKGATYQPKDILNHLKDKGFLFSRLEV